MSRNARVRSQTGIYHAMVRGNNKSEIFWCREDYLKFIQILHLVKGIGKFDVFAYCLMDNHVHLLLKESVEMDISDIMKRINTRYAMWHNYKYRRLGHFFQGRFKSEPVEDEAYYASVLRYIHQNPLKAGICQNIVAYEWSSYKKYQPLFNGNIGCLDNSINLGIWRNWIEFDRFNQFESNDKYLDIDKKIRYTDEALSVLIKNEYDLESAVLCSRRKRDCMLARIKNDTSVTNTQLSKVTGLSIRVVERATKASKSTFYLLE